MKRYSIFMAVLCMVACSSGVQAQVTQSGDLTAHIDSIIADMPTANGGGDYLQPNASSRAIWREIIDHILAEEYADAHTKAQTKNYQVVLFTDTANPEATVHVVLERTPESTSRYWGTYLFHTSPRRSNLVIQSPHPRYDTNTGYQSMRIYQHAAARAYFISGTHRCNGISYSPCDGTTTACSEDAEPYRYSDQCHVTLATFQITTEAMLDDNPELLVIQPHGYGQGSGEPDLIISNGTRYWPSGTDYAVAVRDEIQAIDPSLTAKVGHIDLEWTKNLGTNNTQGRLINGSADPCYTPPTAANGRFVHVEQARIGLRDTPQNWMKLAQAIAAAVPEDATSAPEIARTPKAGILGSYPNPFDSRTRIDFELDREASVQLEVFDVSGRRVAALFDGYQSSGIHSLVWEADRMPSGIYFIRLRHDGAVVDVRKCILLR